jgi:hypothetical protein
MKTTPEQEEEIQFLIKQAEQSPALKNILIKLGLLKSDESIPNNP